MLLLVDDGHNGADALLADGLLTHSSCMASTVLATEHPHPVTLEGVHGHGVTIYGAGYRSDDGTGQGSAEAMTAVEVFPVHDGLVLDGLTDIDATRAPRPDIVTFTIPFVATGKPGRRSPRIIAVGLPSGTGVDSDTVGGPALTVGHIATFTYLEGCQCLPPTWHLRGVVEVVPLGLPTSASRPLAHCPADGALGDHLACAVDEPGPGDHRYTRDVVGLWADSESYPGVAILTASGTVRADTSIVCLPAPKRVKDLVLAVRPEVVPAAGCVQALVLGPGIDPVDTVRADEARAILTSALGLYGKDRQCPTRVLTVVDAGVLNTLPKPFTGNLTCMSLRVLTLHTGEVFTLLITLGDQRAPVQGIRHQSCERVEAHSGLTAHEICRRTGVTVLLKGATTLIATPQRSLVSMDGGPSWMAAARNGDVLAGIPGAVLVDAAAHWEQGAPDASGADPVLDTLIDSITVGVRPYAPAGAYAATSL